LIGNDLIYLPDWPQRQGLRLKRFRAKVFTAKELSLIEEAEQPYFIEALLWSVKEAAYKVWLKATHRPAYNPKNFEVQTELSPSGGSQAKPTEGLVSFEDGSLSPYPFYSTQENDFLATYVLQQTEQPFSESFWRTKQQCILHQARTWKLQKNTLNIPYAIYQNRYLELSLSHDGGLFWYIWFTEPQPLPTQEFFSQTNNHKN